MSEYLDCKCGSKETYISVAGDTCCYPCFKPLSEKVEVIASSHAGVFADNGGWAVKVNGVTKQYFSKHEDYAHTEAVGYARQLNQ